MSFADFYRYMAVTAICFYEPKWNYSWTEAEHKVLPRVGGIYRTNQFYLETTVGKASVLEKPHQEQVPFSALSFECHDAAILSLHQTNHRHVDETMRGTYSYAPVTAILAKVLDKKKPLESDNMVLVDKKISASNTMNFRFD